MLISIEIQKIMQASSYTLFLLGNEKKKFAIYTSPLAGKLIHSEVTGNKKTRPYTHDLLELLFQELSIKPIHVVVWDVEDTTYYAHLFLEQKLKEKRRIFELDTRPSDAFIIALKHNLPLYCREEVFEKVLPIEGPLEL